MRKSLEEAGVPIPHDALLEAATIQGKKKLIEQIQKQEQQQAQMQNMQMKAQLEQMNDQTELSKARAIADEGLGLERASRVQENQALAVERRAEAEKDHAVTLLNLVKALKEIDLMDIQQLEQLITLQQSVKNEEREQEVHVAQQSLGTPNINQ